MAFLDNSGDIILDAVLTDTGRKRLAAGDGSFKIAKFALGDDEINYGLFDRNHASGSAYYDLNILQTPVLEAFTNNTSVLNSKLITYNQNDLLYLPVVKLNTLTRVPIDQSTLLTSSVRPVDGYVMTADVDTTNLFNGVAPAANGLIFGANSNSENMVIFDQGIDSNLLPSSDLSPSDPRFETQYLIEVDNRLLQVGTPESNIVLAQPSFVDDDNIATYYFSLNSNSGYFANRTQEENGIPPYGVQNQNEHAQQTVMGNENSNTGEYGTRFGVRLKAQNQIERSTALFTQMGGMTAMAYLGRDGSNPFYFIDTVVRVTGYTTGYRVDFPIRIIKTQ